MACDFYIKWDNDFLRSEFQRIDGNRKDTISGTQSDLEGGDRQRGEQESRDMKSKPRAQSASQYH